jgi:transposase
MEDRIRELERHLGRKTLEVEILKEALNKSGSKKPTWHAQSQRPDGSA